MGRRKALAPPTMEERAAAAESARALLRVIAGETVLGPKQVMHVDMSRPRRGVWITTWESLPGFCRVNGLYQHELLPDWQYTRAEVRAEMIPDLQLLAERGIRPTEETS